MSASLRSFQARVAVALNHIFNRKLLRIHSECNLTTNIPLSINYSDNNGLGHPDSIHDINLQNGGKVAWGLGINGTIHFIFL